MAMQSGVRYCGLDYFGSADSNWNLIGTTGSRTWQGDVTFTTDYGEAPAVIAMVKSFHILQGEDARLEVGVTDVTKYGFTIVVHTWGDTHIAGVGVQWLAYDI